jgi:Ca2+-binding EF-hand superfamily protein
MASRVISACVTGMQRLRAIFDQMDLDNNGRLDIAELRAAMDYLDEHLDGPMVAEIVEAMGCQGGVDFEVFREIVDAESVRARTPGAAALRALLHDRSQDHFKQWLNSWE